MSHRKGHITSNRSNTLHARNLIHVQLSYARQSITLGNHAQCRWCPNPFIQTLPGMGTSEECHSPPPHHPRRGL